MAANTHCCALWFSLVIVWVQNKRQVYSSCEDGMYVSYVQALFALGHTHLAKSVVFLQFYRSSLGISVLYTAHICTVLLRSNSGDISGVLLL